ncbi:MAG: hypothetical protein J0H34_07800 [Rhizobiales bacterium]|nr:hypothetical protein [Hyphomicrobiales bacterium]
MSFEQDIMIMEPVLAKFFEGFWLKFPEYSSSYDDAAKWGLQDLSADEKARLAPLLDELIGPRHSADDLVELWRRSPAEPQLSNGEQIRELLKAARARIG